MHETREPDTQSEYMTIREAADLLRVHPNTVRGWIWKGRIQGHRIVKKLLVRREDLKALLQDVGPGGAE